MLSLLSMFEFKQHHQKLSQQRPTTLDSQTTIPSEILRWRLESGFRRGTSTWRGGNRPARAGSWWARILGFCHLENGVVGTSISARARETLEHENRSDCWVRRCSAPSYHIHWHLISSQSITIKWFFFSEVLWNIEFFPNSVESHIVIQRKCL